MVIIFLLSCLFNFNCIFFLGGRGANLVRWGLKQQPNLTPWAHFLGGGGGWGNLV